MFEAREIKELRPLNDSVLVSDMNFSARQTSRGIHLLSDDGRSAGVRPRWAQVYAVGPEQTDVSVGQWVLVEHGRWTRGAKIKDQTGEHTVRKVDNSAIMVISDEEPVDDVLSTALQVDSPDRW
jgi:co-chaperonin GroES (HSP10)